MFLYTEKITVQYGIFDHLNTVTVQSLISQILEFFYSTLLFSNFKYDTIFNWEYGYKRIKKKAPACTSFLYVMTSTIFTILYCCLVSFKHYLLQYQKYIIFFLNYTTIDLYRVDLIKVALCTIFIEKALKKLACNCHIFQKIVIYNDK